VASADLMVFLSV